MSVTLTQSAWFLPFVVPICLWVAWSDLRRMKIPNNAVYALALTFVIVGVPALPLQDYLWRYAHLLIVLIIGIVLNAGGILGAGDAKFAAAAAPFIARDDIGRMMMLLGLCMLAGYISHRIAKHTTLHRMAPEWDSWTAGKRFPLGYPMGLALMLYLAWPLLF